MQTESTRNLVLNFAAVAVSLLSPSLLVTGAEAAPSLLHWRDSNPLNIDEGPPPSPQDGPPFSAHALRNPAYLPAQIGGIVGAYALSLVLVSITLLALSKRRREQLYAGNEEADFLERGLHHLVEQRSKLTVRNFSYPAPLKTDFSPPSTFFDDHSPQSGVSPPGIDPFVDPEVVAADRIMAQQQLEEMYRHVMEHEEAKQQGIVLEAPLVPSSASQHRTSTSDRPSRNTLSKKAQQKPPNLNLSIAKEEKSRSRTSSLLSALRSPKKKTNGITISSPLMTPQSATFPQHEAQEMNLISPRFYAPVAPPPVPALSAHPPGSAAPATLEESPDGVQSIDERLDRPTRHQYRASHAPTEADPDSAVSEHSQAPLVGLPSSPKPGSCFPSLPCSPQPGATFQRSNAPTAVRMGGALPLRAYEPPMISPTTIAKTTKQTVFERKGPLSPMSGCGTATAVPYSPYQPFTPCVPMTPSLVTPEDRRRMRKTAPKTPTMEMVKGPDEIW